MSPRTRRQVRSFLAFGDGFMMRLNGFRLFVFGLNLQLGVRSKFCERDWDEEGGLLLSDTLGWYSVATRVTPT